MAFVYDILRIVIVILFFCYSVVSKMIGAEETPALHKKFDTSNNNTFMMNGYKWNDVEEKLMALINSINIRLP